jgi:thiamine-phosphate pyrophosphorylase
MKRIGRLCIITDVNIQERFSHFELAEMAVKGGADMIQFRDKNMSTEKMIDTAAAIKKLCRKYRALLIINDRVDVAMAVDADGVHLGQEDFEVKDATALLGKNKFIGCTAHSLRQAKRAVQDGANYIGYGHIFTTYSKLKKTAPKGIGELGIVCRAVSIPVLAIGGINENNIGLVVSAGAYGVAVIGAVARSRSPVTTVRKLKLQLSKLQ